LFRAARGSPVGPASGTRAGPAVSSLVGVEPTPRFAPPRPRAKPFTIRADHY